MSVVPSQILYLEHGSSRLYVEAIQVVSQRRLCWARPTLLIRGLPEGATSAKRQDMISGTVRSPEQSSLKLYDLEGCPDIIWPITPFQLAYDLDFFSLIVQLKLTPNGDAQRSSRRLSEFIHSFWETHTDIFRFNSASELSS
ncbi:hypothetical protein [cf. Phormidesmis sp. LEGE 11477]|uniref:hypothetical protein n=1 Tax=cf. Phormidesmis sp. LEGE 11477 TaxID=1828680 RepID=UPI00187F8391|nr:hypothetical protein [cf. Phormidesmis sp. LEGE 11477]MBE9063336.1 hypothetical protein [cf. Phormidesmis sp. LEGE 11477]